MTIIWFACSKKRYEDFFPSLPSQFPPPSLFHIQSSVLQCAVLFSQEWLTSYCQFQSSGRCSFIGQLSSQRQWDHLPKNLLLKAAGLGLSQNAVVHLSLSVLSPYANLMESCLQCKRDCPLSQSVIVWVHMCSHAGDVCVCTRQAELSCNDSGIKQKGGFFGHKYCVKPGNI